MPTKTWNLRQINVGGANPNRLWWDSATAAAAATSSSGWTVGTTAAGRYANLNNGTENANNQFSTTIVPDATAPTVDNSYAATAIYTPPTLLNSTDSISTLYEYNGVFPAGTWTFNFPVIAVSSGNNQDGRVGIRVFRGLRSGTAWTSVTEITSARLVGSTVTNLTTAAAQTSTVTWSAPAFDLQNEFLIVKIGWEITGAGTTNTRDVLLRWGTGANITTPNFKKFRHILT
jgi:hypothetical protein